MYYFADSLTKPSNCNCHDSKSLPSSPNDESPCTPLFYFDGAYLPAELVTTEPKYHIFSWIAEFYCTITSPFFALPLIIYYYYDPFTLPSSAHFAILSSVGSAICSTIYHMKIYRILSTVDVGMAMITMYMVGV